MSSAVAALRGQDEQDYMSVPWVGGHDELDLRSAAVTGRAVLSQGSPLHGRYLGP